MARAEATHLPLGMPAGVWGINYHCAANLKSYRTITLPVLLVNDRVGAQSSITAIVEAGETLSGYGDSDAGGLKQQE